MPPTFHLMDILHNFLLPGWKTTKAACATSSRQAKRANSNAFFFSSSITHFLARSVAHLDAGHTKILIEPSLQIQLSCEVYGTKFYKHAFLDDVSTVNVVIIRSKFKNRVCKRALYNDLIAISFIYILQVLCF